MNWEARLPDRLARQLLAMLILPGASCKFLSLEVGLVMKDYSSFEVEVMFFMKEKMVLSR